MVSQSLRRDSIQLEATSEGHAGQSPASEQSEIPIRELVLPSLTAAGVGAGLLGLGSHSGSSTGNPQTVAPNQSPQGEQSSSHLKLPTEPSPSAASFVAKAAAASLKFGYLHVYSLIYVN